MKKLLSILFIIFFCFLHVLKGQTINIDNTFNFGTGFDNDVTSIVIQPDGKIIVGGWFTKYNNSSCIRIVRLNTDGSIDTSFNIGSGFNNLVQTIALQNDGKILVGGAFTGVNGIQRNFLARLNSNGSVDTSFNNQSGPDNWVTSIHVQSDGKIYVGGRFYYFNTTSSSCLIRLNSNGTIDNTFNIGKGFTDGNINTEIYSIITEPNGKIVVGGNFNLFDSLSAGNVIKLNLNGTRDNTFNVGGSGASGGVHSVVYQTDGRFIIAGGFSTYNGTQVNSIVRLSNTGSIDNTFNSNLIFNGGTIESLALQSDGKIIAGGLFTFYSGQTHKNITRINSNGSIDPEFKSGSGFNYDVNKVVLQPDGKILVGGGFASFNGNQCTRIVRLLNPNFASISKTSLIFYKIFPNPSHGELTIEGLSSGKLIVFDAFGRVVREKNVTGKSEKIELGGLSEGVYLFRYNDGQLNMQIGKIILTK